MNEKKKSSECYAVSLAKYLLMLWSDRGSPSSGSSSPRI